MKNNLNNIRFIILILNVFFVSQISAQTYGCTDILANNYNPNATLNDGSCSYNDTSIDIIKSWALPEVLNESSGLIWWNNKLWSHNDDTDIKLYSLDTNDINNYLTYPLISCVNNDWEEISQDSTYIYVGDFGNNVNGNRTNLKILRVDKVSLLQNKPIIDTINFSYLRQTDFKATGSNNSDFDCEAFVVTNDSIYLFSKEWVNNKSTIYSLPKTPGTYSADSVSSFDVQGLITGASYHKEKNTIVLSGYSSLLQPFIVLLYDFHPHDFFSGNKRKISLKLPFTQAEGIATEDGINYFISNEKFTRSVITTSAKINKINLSDFFGTNLISNIQNSSKIEEMEMYPNPIKDLLYIKINGSNKSDFILTIFNNQGQMIHTSDINSNDSKVDVSYLDKGLYYFIITSNNKNIMSKKFVKE